MYLALGSQFRPHHPIKHSQRLCVHCLLWFPPVLTLGCFSSEHRGQRSHLHHFLSTVSSHAAGQAPQQRGGHSHLALDFHQILPGKVWRNYLTGYKWNCWSDSYSSTFFPLCCLKALPYVALLIAMLFFIYAVIGMQVRNWMWKKWYFPWFYPSG